MSIALRLYPRMHTDTIRSCAHRMLITPAAIPIAMTRSMQTLSIVAKSVDYLHRCTSYAAYLQRRRTPDAASYVHSQQSSDHAGSRIASGAREGNWSRTPLLPLSRRRRQQQNRKEQNKYLALPETRDSASRAIRWAQEPAPIGHLRVDTNMSSIENCRYA